MNQQEKDGLLKQAITTLQQVRHKIQANLTDTVAVTKTIKDKLYSLPPTEQLVQNRILSNYEKRAEELDALYPSPYFVKCQIKFDNEQDSRIFYFSKFALPDEHIYSWTSPAATLRFEQPGKFSYAIKDVSDKAGTLISKEQYMITDGKIIFMAAESLDHPRELIFQEYFSQHKSTFILPEIVEQMEKAQDMVIRAHPHGSFLISGPAGSGKTTLALHRVAYLIQSPDTAEQFTENNSIVFVQDESTQQYFGQLLPELGIHNVRITTFATWAREQLKLQEYSYTVRYGHSEKQQDIYEYQKCQALRTTPTAEYDTDIFRFLKNLYAPAFSEESQDLFVQQQQQDRTLDRFDLTALLQAYLHTNGGLVTEDIEYKQLKGGKIQRKKIIVPLKYALIVLDEVQNYLPEQVSLLRQCVDPTFNAIVYVGDLAQQTQLCTIRDWAQAGEQFSEGRTAILQKNYRSTKQILTYIKKLGYAVDIPDTIKSGPEVTELPLPTVEEEIEYVTTLSKNNSDVVIGVISKSANYLKAFREQLVAYTNVHVLSIYEAQGVEFDIVCLVGMDDATFAVSDMYDKSLTTERERVNKDLLYVALTRAMSELHVLGKLTKS